MNIIDLLTKFGEVDPADLRPDARLSEDLGLDSLELYELLLNLEDEAGVLVPEYRLDGIVTVADVQALFDELLSAAPGPHEA